jgi:O-antigen ligase
MKKITFLNLLFAVQLLIVGFVIVGVLPRAVIPFLVIVLALYVLSAKLEDAVAFFARSIPFFVAIPITNSFDSFNAWRILSGLIFLRWLLDTGVMSRISRKIKMSFCHDRSRTISRQVWEFIAKNKVATALFALLLLSILSATQASSHILAIRRVAYFINLSLVGIVAYNLAVKNQNFGQRLIKNIAVPTIIVALVGMAQLVSTYFMDIFQFVDFWAKKMELGLFGSAWANIAIKANTWFAYYGNQLSLRMFSLFPDSHSFPVFLLLGLSAVFAVSLHKVAAIKNGLKTMFFARASLLAVFVPIIFLAAILSGTRGIWVASVGAIMAVFGVIFLLKRGRIGENRLVIFEYVSSYLLLFFLLFGVAYFIFASDQFQVPKSNSVMFGRRVRSVLDISETSNARRIEIWKASLKSILKHPLLGVGIGNFPVVVGEDLARAKAGSSAHNLYLHIAAEMGLPALIFALWFLWLLLKKTYLNFLQTTNYKLQTIYFASALIFLPWVLLYSLTDVAIFDERAFLLFAITCAVIFGAKKPD